MTKPTLARVAAKAGVSSATASRVLNGQPGVSAATRQAVLVALDVLGYERPLALRQRSAGLVGLIIPELSNPVFPAYAQAIESLLAQRGYTPVLCARIPGGVDEDEYVEMLLNRGVAGIIFVSGMHADVSMVTDRYLTLGARVPIVCINGYREDVPAPFLSTNDSEAIQLAVDHLVSLGHHRIGLAIGQRRYVTALDKTEEFRQCIKRLDADYDADELISSTFFTFEGGQTAATQLINRGATAIVCGSDLMALGAIRAARQRGLRVPRDLSVIGYDDSPLIAYTDPPLTTVRQPVDAVASTAAEILIDAITGHVHAPEHYVFSPELIVRYSTGPGPQSSLFEQRSD